MRLAPRYACALSLAAAAACSGVEPLAAPDAPAPARAAGGDLPVAARWANNGSGAITFLNRENSGAPQIGSSSTFTFDAATTVTLGNAFEVGQSSFIEVEGSHAGTTLYAGRVGSDALRFDSFVAHEEWHEIVLPSISGGWERASWSWGAAGSRNSYRASRENGRDTFAGSGDGGTANWNFVVHLDAHNAGSVKAFLRRAIEEGTGVRVGVEAKAGGAFIHVLQVGGSGLAGSLHATGSYSISAAGTVTRRP